MAREFFLVRYRHLQLQVSDARDSGGRDSGGRDVMINYGIIQRKQSVNKALIIRFLVTFSTSILVRKRYLLLHRLFLRSLKNQFTKFLVQLMLIR